MQTTLNQNPGSSHPAAAVRSFIDLRQFAADPRRGKPAADAQGDAFLTARRELDLQPGPVSLGVLTLDGSQGRVDGLPGDEFIILLSGTLSLDTGEARLTLEANQSAVIPRGCGFDWRAGAETSLVFMRYAAATSGETSPLAIDEAAALEASNPPLAELLVGPTPRCRNHTDYRSADGVFTCGVWDSTPYHRRSMAYRHHELMHLLAGAVTFEDAAGRRATFKAGDIFLVEQGAECSWLSEEHVAKVYAIYRPA